MPLTRLTRNALHFPGAVNSVVLEDGRGGALLVDTGLDDSYARKLLKAVEEAGLKPTGILNTHSHADHYGGNALILKRFPGLPVLAPPIEASIMRDPLLEPLYLFGALPPPELRGKFLLAPATPAQEIGPGQQILCGVEVELIPVPGHAVQMYAVRVGEFLYAADALNDAPNLHKHPLIFCVDSARQKESTRKLGDLQGITLTLPGHGEPTQDLPGLAELNVQHYERITQTVLAAVREGVASIDDLLARVCETLGLQMEHAASVVLNRSVVSAHLVELQDRGEVALSVQANKLTFNIP